MPRPMVDFEEATAAALRVLRECGLLLLSDLRAPSVTGIVVGESIHGSWWGHPLGHVIYRVVNAMVDHPDVLSTKLIDGKVTFVERRLWPAVYTVGTARRDWQMRRLSETARWLLAEVDAVSEIRIDSLPLEGKRATAAARMLERRLLVHSTEVHTESGAHAKELETWPRWASRARLKKRLLAEHTARAALEQAAAQFAADDRLPWR